MELLLAIVTVSVAAFLSHLAVEFGLSSRAKTETGEVRPGHVAHEHLGAAHKRGPAAGATREGSGRLGTTASSIVRQMT